MCERRIRSMEEQREESQAEGDVRDGGCRSKRARTEQDDLETGQKKPEKKPEKKRVRKEKKKRGGKRVSKLRACLRLQQLARKYAITEDEGREMAEGMGLRGFDERYKPDLRLSAFERLVVEVEMWRAGEVAAAEQAGQEPPAPRRPSRKDNEGDVGVRVDNERQRQLGQYKIRGKVQPKRSPEDVDRLGVAMGFSRETKWWDWDEAFERLIVDVREWRAGEVAAAVQAGEKRPAPRRPRSNDNEGGVGGRVETERMRQLGQKISGKVQPKRSPEDVDRLGVALGFSRETKWWR